MYLNLPKMVTSSLWPRNSVSREEVVRRLIGFLPNGMLVHCRVTPSPPRTTSLVNCLYSWVERGTGQVKCPQPQLGLKPRRLDIENNYHTDHYTTAVKTKNPENHVVTEWLYGVDYDYCFLRYSTIVKITDL